MAVAGVNKDPRPTGFWQARRMHSTELPEFNDRHTALRYILDAWEEALHDGIEPESIANASLFAALSDLVATYGEDAVSHMATGLSQRIQHGEFTLNRTTQ